MDTPGYIILSRLSAQLRATEVLANNIANGDTPGFRAERSVFGAKLQPDRAPIVPGDRTVAYSVDRATWRDTAPGGIAQTGNPLDVAIQGEGFFAVETPRGERFTRAGRFSLDQARQLVDTEGNPVLDTSGRPIAFAAGDSRIEISGDGTVRSENGVVGRLGVVRFGNAQALLAEGNRLFRTDQTPEPVARPQLVQGAVEGSNVSPVVEIGRLTEEVRQFQFAIQFSEREGERLQTAVERILRKQT